ncbi:prepilin-type N-terminal cleavage/methylation domain-containing protein [Texcoconibacillus texcoconensis]|uniref:Prepilin-type N-terminal cleavage/methylation domain-containing protein n=2 Tax=Texcoconibacillus texcoconensis TaxID=1095777 RepID=A0A840QRZ2_9BACI|nr:prepilin-type N-terminal cleavage/methylation domain-containing protein [Texcoconibacillus texcoconensis]
MMNKTSSNEGAFTLIEVLIAIAIIGTFVGVFGFAMTNGVQTSVNNEARLDAMLTAQDYLEEIRAANSQEQFTALLHEDRLCDDNVTAVEIESASGEADLYEIEVRVSPESSTNVEAQLKTRLYDDVDVIEEGTYQCTEE